MTPHSSVKIELKAQIRNVLGHKVKNIRGQGFIPAVMYGKGQDTVSIQVPEKDFGQALKRAGESTLVYLTIDGQTHPTIIHDVSRDKADEHIVHADFYKVRLDQKIKAMVPVKFEGESGAVKNHGGIFVRSVSELEVEALPQNLPHEILVNISGMENLKDQVLVKDIKIEDARLVANPELIVALVQEPMSEEELKKSLEGEALDVTGVKVGEDKESVEGEGPEEAAPAEARPDKGEEK